MTEEEMTDEINARLETASQDALHIMGTSRDNIRPYEITRIVALFPDAFKIMADLNDGEMLPDSFKEELDGFEYMDWRLFVQQLSPKARAQVLKGILLCGTDRDRKETALELSEIIDKFTGQDLYDLATRTTNMI